MNWSDPFGPAMRAMDPSSVPPEPVPPAPVSACSLIALGSLVLPLVAQVLVVTGAWSAGTPWVVLAGLGLLALAAIVQAVRLSLQHRYDQHLFQMRWCAWMAHGALLGAANLGRPDTYPQFAQHFPEGARLAAAAWDRVQPDPYGPPPEPPPDDIDAIYIAARRMMPTIQAATILPGVCDYCRRWIGVHRLLSKLSFGGKPEPKREVRSGACLRRRYPRRPRDGWLRPGRPGK